VGKKNRPALSRAIKSNGAKLYVTIFGGRELKTLFLQLKCKQIFYLFYVFSPTHLIPFLWVKK